jgi:pimeloyl-ACP methyl ester carboxylesterase
MHREKLFVDVGGAADGACHARRLLALLAVDEFAVEEDTAVGRRYSDVMVYLHGFPDVAVHPTKLDFASRLPFKLAEAWLEQAPASKQQAARGEVKNDVAFLAFNFGGVVGSDAEMAFFDKTVSQEVDDAVRVCEFVRTTLLRQGIGRLHVVGISTGAIIGSLLRAKHVADTITVIAGLANLQSGIRYDFTDDQMRQFDKGDACWKEFYLPDGCALPTNAIMSLDGEEQALPDQLAALVEIPRKVYLRLHRRYLDECVLEGREKGRLDIRSAVATPACPLLVIHGDADQNVPFADGEQLFAAAAEPKQFVAIAKGNHLLTNSKHLKKALQVILTHCREYEKTEGVGR